MTYESTYFLVTLGDAKLYLGLTATDQAQDNMCGMVLGCVTYWMERYTRRKLKNRLLTEYYDGSGREILFLRNYPINSTPAEIIVNDDVDHLWPTSNNVAAADLVIDSEAGRIGLVGSAFARAMQNVKTIYEAGYGHGTDLVPPDLAMASYELLGYLWQRVKTKNWNYQTVNVMSGGITILDSGAPKIVRDLLKDYVSHWKSAA